MQVGEESMWFGDEDVSKPSILAWQFGEGGWLVAKLRDINNECSALS